MVTDTVGLYVHIPFCKSKCRYCDFCSSVQSEEIHERYAECLVQQIRSYKRDEPISVGTVFVGGGTPSVLSCALMEKIFSAIGDTFLILPGSEITVEANPNTLTRELLECYKRCGVNRISIGIQSIHENELKILGRTHSFADAKNAADLIREAGFVNFNVDLMYGIPEQTKGSFRETLAAVIDMKPTHISCYGLILEEGTPLYNERDKLVFPTEDAECEMYYLARDMLSANGYEHYEISNYAKDGFYSFHNLRYWHDEEYIGVGLSAHSYFGGKRFYSPASLSEYFEGCGVKYISEDDDPDRSFEYVMMRLRLREGFSLSEYEELFGESFTVGREAEIERFRSGGFLTVAGGRIALTDKGMYVSNYILSSLL